MALTKYKLGDLIELSVARNRDLEFGIDDVRGISIQKSFIDTKADMSNVSLRPYYLVRPGDFAYVTVTSRNGEKITIAHNTSQDTYIVSSSYIVFHISCPNVLLEDYLFIYFNRPEFDRYARYNSWGSARETFDWWEMCDIDIELPSLEIQKKYADIYNSMLENQRCYERGLKDLKLGIDATIDQHKHIAKRAPLIELMKEIDVRNENGALNTVYGITMEKKFIISVANLNDVNITRYKLVAKGQLACNFMHVGRDESLPIAINNTEESLLVSPAYFVFDMKTEECLPEYILMWLSREESGRYCWYISDTSIRSGFSLDCFYDIEIPVLNKKIQEALVDLFNAYQRRREINEQLKTQLRDICPILIRGSIEEGARDHVVF